MIFIILGSQKFQFNRLLIEVDDLLKNGVIKEEVFAQIGYSDYIPKNYRFEKFLDRETFIEYINNSSLIISHGGTGAIITSIKMGKKVIAVPRLKAYGEHVDNHQIDITSQFTRMNFIYSVNNVKELSNCIDKIRYATFNKYYSNTSNIISILDNFIK